MELNQIWDNSALIEFNLFHNLQSHLVDLLVQSWSLFDHDVANLSIMDDWQHLR